MNKHITDTILSAEARALATYGPHGVNVVPVSVVKVEGENIYLFNFFMGKTAENLQSDTSVALTCWLGLEGVQIRATAEYITEGDMFDAATTEMKERFPDRTLKGIIKLTPSAAYDISADAARAGKVLELD